MTGRFRPSGPGPAVLGVLLVLAGPPVFASGEGETVYCSDPVANHVVRVDFDASAATTVNTDASLRQRLGGIAVRDDVSRLQIIVTDKAASQVLLYPPGQGQAQTIADGLTLASGVSLDGDGNLFVVGAAPATAPTHGLIWKIPRGRRRPGGYRSPVLIDGRVPSSRLAEARIYPANGAILTAGDLLVVSEKPPAVFRYPRDVTGFAARETFIPQTALPARPLGIAFTPDGGLLIAGGNGTVARYDTSGNRLQPDFVSGLPRGDMKISVGFQDQVDHVFVSSAGFARRFDIRADGTGELNQSLSACAAGGALSMGSATSSPTPAGSSVVVEPAEEVQIEFDDVTDSGLTRARVLEFPDNRPSGTGQSLRAFFPGDPALQALLPDPLVPAYIQAFPKRRGGDPPGGPFTGPPTFVMALIDTTAQFRRTAQVREEEKKRLGYAPGCLDADQARQPRAFYAPETDPPRSEAPLVEGAVFTDFSTGCGSNIGRGSNFSLWLTGRDMRTATVIVNDKYDNLQSALAAYSTFIEDTLEGTLNGHLAASRSAFGVGDTAAAIAAMQIFVAAIDANPSGFQSHPISLPGHLIARAFSLIFLLPKTI